MYFLSEFGVKRWPNIPWERYCSMLSSLAPLSNRNANERYSLFLMSQLFLTEGRGLLDCRSTVLYLGEEKNRLLDLPRARGK